MDNKKEDFFDNYMKVGILIVILLIGVALGSFTMKSHIRNAGLEDHGYYYEEPIGVMPGMEITYPFSECWNNYVRITWSEDNATTINLQQECTDDMRFLFKDNNLRVYYGGSVLH